MAATSSSVILTTLTATLFPKLLKYVAYIIKNKMMVLAIIDWQKIIIAIIHVKILISV